MFELTNLKLQENNPRFIKDERFAKLKQSIEQFPKMMALRPIVTDTNGVVLGGNMRLRALLDLGFKSVPESWVKKADELTEEEKRRFIIADNTGFGQWDYEILSNEWEAVELEEWGFEAPDEWGDMPEKEELNQYTNKIKAPTYEPSGDKPEVTTLFDDEKACTLIKAINTSKLSSQEKDFLKRAAQRHVVFNYELIADFYAHSSQECQELMEDSALVIIDFDKAIENGYTELSDETIKAYKRDYNK